jgi:hypothetical protein
MEVSLLCVAAILTALANRELSQPDWDLEWLVTLPLRMPVLLLSRIMERSVANPYGLLSLWPAGSIIAWISGFRWSSPLVGIVAVLPLLILSSVLRTLVDTGLRLSLAPSRLRNLQALLSIFSIVMLYVAISLGMPAPLEFIVEWARDFPAWACWLPPGLAVRALNAANPAVGWGFAALLILETGLALWAGIVLLVYQLRHGVVGASSRETGRSGRRASASLLATAPPVTGARSSGSQASGWAGSWITVVQRRELTLLGRDRSFMVQTLVLPVVIVASQIVFQGRLRGASLAGASDAAVASIAFGIAAYTLMMSAFQTLNSEGGALWLLFTVPRPLESVLREKARLWAVLALGYPLLVFTFAMAVRGRFDIELVGLAAIVLLGVPIYAVIAVALGVFASDPLAQEVRSKLRPTYVYLYFLLCGLYTYALYASAWSQRIVLIVLSGLLAVSLWQKARDELPYLLDAAASPPARVSTSDGVIAAMIFFVAQGIVIFALSDPGHPLSGGAIVTAYAIAGAVAYGLTQLSFWRSKTLGVPRIFRTTAEPASAVDRDGPLDRAGAAGHPGVEGGTRAAAADAAASGGHTPWARASLWGVGAGLVAAALGAAYLYALRRLDVAQEVMHESAHGLAASPWIPLLAIVAAPLFEEFIFRGLIFRGLRRSWGALTSVAASAAVFAIVHPPISMIPVFGLGVCAAFAFDRTKILLAPMIAHGVYNAIIMACQQLTD